MKKFTTSIFVSLLFLILFSVFSPLLVKAAGLTSAPTWQGFVPCGRYKVDPNTDEERETCTLCHLIIGIQRLFDYGVYFIASIALLGIFLAGGLYIVSSGDEGLMTQAKSFLRAALLGFVLVVGSWLIVHTTLLVIGGNVKDLGIKQANWWSFDCETKN